MASAESRVLLTEDKDFGLRVFAGGFQTAGVVLIRFPAPAREALAHTGMTAHPQALDTSF